MDDTVDLARRVRLNALRMVHKAGASHIGSALSISDILAVLYGRVMCYDTQAPSLAKRDRFILSKGHACVAVYSVLAEIGFLTKSELDTYGQNFSPLMNHISHKVSGVEFSTGSLGHGLSFAAGKALAAKKMNMDWRAFVLLSDGEMDEGSNWEALMFSSHHALDNLVAIIDYNKLQSMGSCEKTLGLEPLADKLKSFGWFVIEVDGHNHQELYDALTQRYQDKPTVIIAHTIKGKGVSFMEGKVEWHYKCPDQDQLIAALKELGD